MKAIKRKWIANQLFNFKKENELVDFTLNGYIIEWRFDSTKHETRIKIDFAANKSRYFLNGKSHIKYKKKPKALEVDFTCNFQNLMGSLTMSVNCHGNTKCYEYNDEYYYGQEVYSKKTKNLFEKGYRISRNYLDNLQQFLVKRVERNSSCNGIATALILEQHADIWYSKIAFLVYYQFHKGKTVLARIPKELIKIIANLIYDYNLTNEVLKK
jgi:hypothetical protein